MSSKKDSSVDRSYGGKEKRSLQGLRRLRFSTIISLIIIICISLIISKYFGWEYVFYFFNAAAGLLGVYLFLEGKMRKVTGE